MLAKNKEEQMSQAQPTPISRMTKANVTRALEYLGYENMQEAISAYRLIPGISKNIREAGVKKLLKQTYNEEIERHRAYQNDRYIHTLRYHKYSSYTVANGTERIQDRGIGSVTFVSRTPRTLIPFTVTEAGERWDVYRRNNGIPQQHIIYTDPGALRDDDITDYFFNADIINDIIDHTPGSDGRTVRLLGITHQKIQAKDMSTELKNQPLYNASVKSATKAFRGFEDKGEMRCVPEILTHHLQRSRNKKKVTLEEIIYILDNPCTFGNILITDGTGGYTSLDIVRVLDHFRVPYKLLDIEERVFLQDTKSETFNTNIPVFVGQVFDNHLYYCSDADYIKSLASKETQKTNRGVCMKKTKKKFEGDVLPIADLTEMFIKNFGNDKTLRKVGLYNDKIVKIEYDDKTIYANPDVNLVREIITKIPELNFENQNMINLGKYLFGKLNPVHKQSQFNQSVFNAYKAHTGIVRVFNKTTMAEQYSIDINKCRSACFRDNRLGDYAVFGISSDIEEYREIGHLRLGIYYVIIDSELFSTNWYSNQFVDWLKNEGFSFTIKYQVLAIDSLPADIGTAFVDQMVELAPDNYKTIVNTLIGYFGKTISKYSKGYLEPSFENACSKFWGTNNIGTIYDLPDHLDTTERKRMRTTTDDRVKLVDVGKMYINDETALYKVSETIACREYINDLPIYQKVLENEWIRVYELRKKMGGRLIKIKTDNVVVENADNEVELSNTIGGYKLETKIINTSYIDIEKKEVEEQEHETKRVWKEIKVEIGDADNLFEKLLPKLPTGSFCLTGLAGYGKSECIKQMQDYNDESTMKVAFTNKATESMNGQTICRTFGIDFNSGLGSMCKIASACHNVKKIINDECFMTPSYCMGIFEQIRKTYPEIAFIGVGDPEQTRPVGEEGINWLDTSVFYDLCNGTIVRLIENQRNDLTPEYHQLIEGKPFNINNFGDHIHSWVNICRTNKMRVHLNANYMRPTGMFIEYNKDMHHPKGQDVYLREGMPVMNVTTDLEKGYINSKMWRIEQVNDDEIYIEGFKDPIKNDEFMKNFVVAYAFTNHKVQSITIKEPFVIWEWSKMSNREKYTAFSRTAKREYVKIYE